MAAKTLEELLSEKEQLMQERTEIAERRNAISRRLASIRVLIHRAKMKGPANE